MKPDHPSKPRSLISLRAGGGVRVAAALFAGLLLLYHANGSFLAGNDAVPNAHLPLRVLANGSLSFTPKESPFMFLWQLESRSQLVVVKFDRWDSRPSDPTTACFGASGSIATEHATWQQLFQQGRLRLFRPDYYLVPSIDPTQRGYVNQYGPGAGLTALPFFALQSLWVGDLAQHKFALWYGAKFVGAFCTALSAAVVYLALRRLADPCDAFVIAVAYGIGTCAWSVCSQTLWQSSASMLFVSLAAYCVLRLDESDGWAGACALATACGVLCRPTTALLVLVIGVFIAVESAQRWRQNRGGLLGMRAWRPLIVYFVAGLPLAAFLGYYNWYYLGAPWRFGQTEAGRQIAAMQLGSSDLWQTAWLEGFSGLLISPSRGILVYSPILAFALWGVVRLWRIPELKRMRPLSIAAVLLVVVHAKWFDWHGGHSFGYRLIADISPLLAICGVAVAPAVRRKRSLLGLFAVAALWSVGVQVIGVIAYDVIGWNAREVYAVKPPGEGQFRVFTERESAAVLAQRANVPLRRITMDVDLKCNRWRLWSLSDSQLVFYLTHFAESRQRKKQITEDWLQTYVLKPRRPR